MKHNNSVSHPTQSQSCVSQWNSIPILGNQTLMALDRKQTPNYSPQSILKKKPINSRLTLQHQYGNCKVCGRKNHRTIDCYYKRTTECFNCGHNHSIRDCTLPPNFQ
ncbi:unnamed protein product [Rotaria sp. Silwood1]|nr:unnamed protein product [Rotaria sp. Silwood1]